MSTNVNVNSLIAQAKKLDGGNYYDWAFQMQMIFRRAGIWAVMTGLLPRPKEPDEGSDPKALADVMDWERKSEEGLTAIGLTIEESQTIHIRECETGPAAWAALKTLYARSGRAARITLKRQLYTYTHDPSAPMLNYITGITTLVSKLAAIGVVLGEEEVTDILIFALDSTYAPVATSLMHTSSPLTIADVKSSLLAAEEQLNNQTESPVALLARSAPAARARLPHREKKPDAGCYRCGAQGHIARNCPAPTPRHTHESEDSEETAMVAHTQYAPIPLF